MAKIYVQSVRTVWSSTASIAKTTSACSGSLISEGYARLVGLVYTSASLVAGSGVRVRQSPTLTPNWDYTFRSTVSTGGTSAFSVEVVGRAVEIELLVGADDATSVRTWWGLRPI